MLWPLVERRENRIELTPKLHQPLAADRHGVRRLHASARSHRRRLCVDDQTVDGLLQSDDPRANVRIAAGREVEGAAGCAALPGAAGGVAA